MGWNDDVEWEKSAHHKNPEHPTDDDDDDEEEKMPPQNKLSCALSLSLFHPDFFRYPLRVYNML